MLSSYIAWFKREIGDLLGVVLVHLFPEQRGAGIVQRGDPAFSTQDHRIVLCMRISIGNENIEDHLIEKLQDFPWRQMSTGL